MDIDKEVNKVAQKTGQTTTVVYIILAIVVVIVASKIFGF